MSRLFGAGLLLAGVLYPFAVYFGAPHYSARQFGLLLGALWLARALTGHGHKGLAWSALAFCVAMAGLGDTQLLRWYPVLLSAGLLVIFSLSLRHGMPVAERLARLTDPELPPKAIRYTRQVTQAWCLFFLLNGLAAASLALWAPLAWWALYTGVIAYLLMGVLFAGEWMIRQRVRARP
ncbi:hypothetical protein [Pseudomonas sp. RIT-PI-S]|uniref:COG4648 family protein n=1 Tax=Pseudomonas sp. RIT-PI-S TaxID=3035295 RepID=UPI0021D8647F|nr:hypothetical protein [Pseudomonas sp. RIT-PI-S]